MKSLPSAFVRFFIVLACILGGSVWSVIAAPPAKSEVQILLKPKADMSENALHAVLAEHGARQHDTIPALEVRIIRVSEKGAAGLLQALQRRQDVEYAELDAEAHAIGTANDPYFANGSQWHLAKVQAPAAWDLTTGNLATVIAILDTGVNSSHPDLSGKVLGGYNYVAGNTDTSDDNGHGTGVAGTAAPNSNNLVGVAGPAWVNAILPVKVLDANGSGTYSGIANGIIYAADRDARVINLSLGGSSSSRTLQDAVNYAWNKKAVIIAAAGNNGTDAAVYPGACQNVVAVSATRSDDTLASWSSYGSFVDLAAPGEGIITLSSSGGYASVSGTSFSSPLTAGVVALMMARNLALTNAQVVDILLKNTDDLGVPGLDTSFGSGRLNAFRSVSASTNYVEVDSTLPKVTITSPAEGDRIRTSTVKVGVAASDNVGVVKVELYVDGKYHSVSTAAPFALKWSAGSAAKGSHTLQARAVDRAGNIGVSAIITVQK
jgi:thermitase